MLANEPHLAPKLEHSVIEEFFKLKKRFCESFEKPFFQRGVWSACDSYCDPDALLLVLGEKSLIYHVLVICSIDAVFPL